MSGIEGAGSLLRAIEATRASSMEVGRGNGEGALQVDLPEEGAGLLLERAPLPDNGELLLVRRFLGGGSPQAAADDALRLEHLIRAHLATRLLAPLAHLAGPSGIIGIESARHGDGASQERLVRHVARSMESVLVLASEVLPEARRSGRPHGWVELSRLLKLLASSFLSPMGARVSQRIEVVADGPVWLRVRRPQFRLLMEMCLDIVLSSGLDARIEVRSGEPWPILQLSALPASDSTSWGLGDLSLVPAARALANSLELPIEFTLGYSGLAEMQQVLVGSRKGRGPVVGLCCLDEDLLDLLSAVLESLGVVAVDLNATDPHDVDPTDARGLDVVLVDLDSQDDVSTLVLAELRRRIPHAPMLALTSEPVVDDGWQAIATKPVCPARLVELLEFIGE